ncbi:hypothetical protein MVEN_01416900 [Mycena venus]|uniref:Uncharacterized protein n=1 Tax=Mycena venus TaxID=2733690 RepID=A0A8H6XXH6_9AGAR|nr:hypothetical protein MVEN_01416900 [Mycena venus]
MQCKLILAFVASFLALAASAAPVPEAGKALHFLPVKLSTHHLLACPRWPASLNPNLKPRRRRLGRADCMLKTSHASTAYYTVPSPNTRASLFVVALRPHTHLLPKFH